ncbi:zinc finger protein 26 [Teleopsis dalmanni]|uniref:zinc finger protein 26 n=1 Tax=Teleopsis dalmanni TaxID=139649 RepID=UPI0018CE2B2D|nr:zinc finger protein 26 [Teleopsis dalmanni]
MTTESDILESIEACRTCGIFYITSSNFLKPIFSTPVADPEMCQIRHEFSTWKLEINENDGYPQYICNCCIHQFQKVLQFRRSCLNVQGQFREFFNLRQQNPIQIKTEIIDPDDDLSSKHFIYVDDLSDNEYDGTPFHIPHMPIKEEVIEAANVPNEMQPIKIEPNCSDVLITPNSSLETQSFIQNIDSLKIIDDLTHGVVNIKNDLVLMNIKGEPKENVFENEMNSVLNTALIDNKVQCAICLHKSENQTEHKHHMEHIHETKNYDCHLCGKKLINCTLKRYQYHLKWHKIGKHIKCAQCGFFCTSKAALNEHTRAIHSKVSCKLCGKSVFPKKLNAHMKEMHSMESIKCIKCNMAFATESERDLHIWKIHASESNNSYKDINLHSIQSDLQNLKNYTIDVPSVSEEQIGPQINITQFTDMETSVSNVLIEDTVLTTSEHNALFFSNDEASKVSYCTQLTDGDDNSSDTTYASEGDNIGSVAHQFVCALCANTFETVEELYSHNLDHKNDSTFSCQICGEKFFLKFSLNRHLKKHDVSF